ncbi:MAG: NfeD family protein [Actinomycetales bacterium]|nr:NfeD family protein [Actinomycetales bacterium]
MARTDEGVTGVFPDLIQYIWILWLCLIILFVVIELLTLEFTFLMIAAGSLLGGLGTYVLGGPWWLQIGLAAVISALLLFTIRPLLLRTLKKGADPTKSNIDALHELGGRVMTDFVEGSGTVKLDNGETWTARLTASSAEARPVEGDRVRVVRILGATAEVAPVVISPSPDLDPDLAPDKE